MTGKPPIFEPLKLSRRFTSSEEYAVRTMTRLISCHFLGVKRSRNHYFDGCCCIFLFLLLLLLLFLLHLIHTFMHIIWDRRRTKLEPAMRSCARILFCSFPAGANIKDYLVPVIDVTDQIISQPTWRLGESMEVWSERNMMEMWRTIRLLSFPKGGLPILFKRKEPILSVPLEVAWFHYVPHWNFWTCHIAIDLYFCVFYICQLGKFRSLEWDGSKRIRGVQKFRWYKRKPCK